MANENVTPIEKNDGKIVATNTTPISELKKAKKESGIDSVTTLNTNVYIKRDESEGKKKFFVHLPHTGYEFNVRGLSVEEEDEIKASNTTPKKSAETIMRVLYNCISNDMKKADSPFASFESFCRNITQADRDALTVAVTQMSYESTHDMIIRCGRCGKQFVEQVCIPDCMEYHNYTGDIPILQRRKILEFTDLHWKLYLKLPTVQDELNQLSDSISENKASDYLFIEKIEFTDKDEYGHEFNETYTDLSAIYGMIKKQPAIFRKRLLKEFEKFVGDWGVEGKYSTVCKNCNNNIEVGIVPVSHFLSMVQ